MAVLLIAVAAGWFGWQHTQQRAAVTLSTADRGRILVETNECRDCHRPNDPFKAPTLEGLFNSEVDLSDGQTVTADENYIRDALLNPGKHIAYGYQNTMPSYRNKLKAEDIELIVEYITKIGRTDPNAPSAPSTSAQ